MIKKFGLILILSLIIIGASAANAAVPWYISIQGIIVGGATFDSIAISLCTNETAPAYNEFGFVWDVVNNKSLEADPIPIQFKNGKVYIDDKGFFSVRFPVVQPVFMGNTIYLNFDKQYYLNIQTIKSNIGTDLAPRLPLRSAPYSLNTGNVIGGDVNNPRMINIYNSGIAITGNDRSTGKQIGLTWEVGSSSAGVCGIGDYIGVGGWGAKYGIYADSILAGAVCNGSDTGLLATGGSLGINAFGGAFGAGIRAGGGQYGGAFFGNKGHGILAFTYAAAGKAAVLGTAAKDSSIGISGFSGKGDGVVGEGPAASAGSGVHAINNGYMGVRAEGPIVEQGSLGGMFDITYKMSFDSYLGGDSQVRTRLEAYYDTITMPKTTEGYAIYLPTTYINYLGAYKTGYELYVNGKAAALAFDPSSDKRLKTNILPLSGALGKISKINGVYYDWNDQYKSLNKAEKNWRREVGFIGQDVQKVFPELVTESGKEKHIELDYSRMTAVLLQAIKELKAENAELEARLTKLEGKQ